MYFSIPEIEVAGFEPALDIMLSALPTELHPNLSIRSWGDDQICVNSQNHIDFPLYILCEAVATRTCSDNFLFLEDKEFVNPKLCFYYLRRLLSAFHQRRVTKQQQT